MITYQVDPVIYKECNTYPLTCLHCVGEDIIFSERKENCKCNECGQWQLKEEE